MFSHPTHLNSANEHKVAVQVLEFLIEHQDHFVLGLSHPPPANVSPADLTAVSQPTRPEEVYFEPSDSDEDLGVLEAHEGGGALLAKRSVSGSQSGGATTPIGGKRRLFKKGRAAKGGADMQTSLSVQSVADARAENERLQGQVIGLRPGSTSPLPPSSGDSPGTPNSASKIRRSKTTPTRRTASGRVQNSPKLADTPEHGRRRSDETGSPSASAAGSPTTSPKQPSATPLSTHAEAS